MKNLYYNQIVELLSARDEGMRICNIARNIYNSNCDLFDNSHQWNSIYESVRQYLWRESRKKKSPFCRIDDKWGTYGLKKGFVEQLELCFDDWDEDRIMRVKKPEKIEMPMFDFGD